MTVLAGLIPNELCMLITNGMAARVLLADYNHVQQQWGLCYVAPSK